MNHTSFLKRLCAIITLLFYIATPSLAFAIDLDSAFTSLVGGPSAAINKAGAFQAGGRGIYTLGGADVRFGGKSTTNVTLISLTPPKYNAGCNGISAFFGGFSFIAGDQIKTLIQSISQGATGYVVHLVIKTLCPQCESVLQLMNKLSKMAAQSSIDACKLSARLVEEAASAGRKVIGEEAAKGVDSSVSATSGAFKDFGDALENGAKQASAWMKNFNEWVNKQPADVRQAAQSQGGMGALYGNVSWQVISKVMGKPVTAASAFDVPDTVAERLFLLNIGGVIYNRQDGTPTYKAPAINPGEATALLMCGAKQDTSGSTDPGWAFIYGKLTAYCGGVFNVKLEDKITYDCGPETESGGNPYVLCNNVVEVKLKDSKLVTGAGLIYGVYNTLSKAITAARLGQELPTEAVALIQAVPFPLYQLINLGAIYPAAAYEMAFNTSQMIAMYLAINYLQGMISASPKDASGNTPDVDRVYVDRLVESIATMHAKQDKLKTEMAQTLLLQQALVANIREVNKIVQQQVMSEEMGTNMVFSESLLKGVSGTAKGTTNNSSWSNNTPTPNKP